MPPKRASQNPSTSTSTSTSTLSSSSSTFSSSNKPTKSSPSSSSSSTSAAQTAQQVLLNLWQHYLRTTPQRVKLIDAFMGFLVAVGVLQFAYCVLVGNYPFNAFLSGFGATVAQFVLTASLRIQTNPQNKGEFGSVSHERAFADFVLGSLILHFFCVNFIN